MIVLVLWTVLGIAGVVLALYRGERVRVRRGVSALLVVWAVYLSVLLVVSRAQPSRVLSPGQDRCFDEMCFAVLGAEAMEGFRTRGSEPERLLRVTVHVSNHGKRQTESEAALRAYLLDTRGHRWSALPGLSGVPLTVPVPPGGSTLSSPVYSPSARRRTRGSYLLARPLAQPARHRRSRKLRPSARHLYAADRPPGRRSGPSTPRRTSRPWPSARGPSMILGIGTDLIEIARIEASVAVLADAFSSGSLPPAEIELLPCVRSGPPKLCRAVCGQGSWSQGPGHRHQPRRQLDWSSRCRGSRGRGRPFTGAGGRRSCAKHGRGADLADADPLPRDVHGRCGCWKT